MNCWQERRCLVWQKKKLSRQFKLQHRDFEAKIFQKNFEQKEVTGVPEIKRARDTLKKRYSREEKPLSEQRMNRVLGRESVDDGASG